MGFFSRSQELRAGRIWLQQVSANFILDLKSALTAKQRNGQLGLGEEIGSQSSPAVIMNGEQIERIGCGCEHSLVLMKSGEVFVFGSNP